MVVVERPEQREGQRHGQDLRHTYRHTQEAKDLQLLRASDKTVYLGTAALEIEKKKWQFKIVVYKKAYPLVLIFIWKAETEGCLLRKYGIFMSPCL